MPFHYDLPFPELLPGDVDHATPPVLERILAPAGAVVPARTPVALVRAADNRLFHLLNEGDAVVLAWLVEPGQSVVPGQPLARLGADGECIPYGRPLSALLALT